MKKIIIDAQALQTNSSKQGIGRYTIGFIYALSKIKEFKISLTINGRKDNIFRILEENRIDLKKIKIINIYPTYLEDYNNIGENRYLDNQFIYYKIVENENPDYFIVPSMMEVIYDEFIAPPIEMIRDICTTAIIAHDIIPLEEIDYYLSSATLKISYQICLLRYALADVILCNSNHTREQLLSYNPSLSCVVLHGGITEKFILNTNKPKADFLLYAGGLSKRKNIDYLLEEYLSIPQEVRKKFELVIVAGPNKKAYNRLQKKYKKNKEIKILGFIEDSLLKRLYSECKLFIFPSKKEGLGLTVLEAIGSGASAIVANTSSLKEIIQNKKFRFDLEKGQLKELLLKLISSSNELRELNKLCASIKEKYRWGNQGNEIKEIIEKTMKTPILKKEICFSCLGLRHRNDNDCKALAHLLYLNFIPNIYLGVNSVIEEGKISYLDELATFLKHLTQKYSFIPNLIPVAYDSNSENFTSIYKLIDSADSERLLPFKKNDFLLIHFDSSNNPSINLSKDLENKLISYGIRILRIDCYKKINDIILTILKDNIYMNQFNTLIKISNKG